MAPFSSKAQQKFMFKRHPKIAKRWAKETPDIKGLPSKLSLNERIKRAKKK